MDRSNLNLVAPLAALGMLTLLFVTLPGVRPASSDELAEVAVGYYKAKQPELAKDELTASLRQDPKNHRAHYVAGMIALDEGNNLVAIEHLKAAVTAKPDDWDATLSLGVAYQNAHDYRAASTLYNKVVDAQPRNAKVYYNMGMLAITVLQYRLAKQCLENYVKLAPNASDLGFVHQRLAELDNRLKPGKSH